MLHSIDTLEEIWANSSMTGELAEGNICDCLRHLSLLPGN